VTQIDYYTERVKRMVGKVLTGNGITRYNQGAYGLVGGIAEGFCAAVELSDAEREELLQLCRQRLDTFREQRGEEVCCLLTQKPAAPGTGAATARRSAARSKSGCSPVPRAAANAAAPAVAWQAPHQRALEVDHILPRNQGGSDDLSNLQALCIADAHSGALFPAPGILATLQSDHEDFSALLSEIDGIGKSTQHHPADLTVDQGKRLRRDENALNRSRNGFGKVLGQRRLTRAVPALGFQKILHRLWQEANRGERHPRPSWLRTSSQGTAAPGLARWAVQRRSS
jgi:hypothetical protein